MRAVSPMFVLWGKCRLDAGAEEKKEKETWRFVFFFLCLCVSSSLLARGVGLRHERKEKERQKRDQRSTDAAAKATAHAARLPCDPLSVFEGLVKVVCAHPLLDRTIARLGEDNDIRQWVLVCVVIDSVDSVGDERPLYLDQRRRRARHDDGYPSTGYDKPDEFGGVVIVHIAAKLRSKECTPESLGVAAVAVTIAVGACLLSTRRVTGVLVVETHIGAHIKRRLALAVAHLLFFCDRTPKTQTVHRDKRIAFLSSFFFYTRLRVPNKTVFCLESAPFLPRKTQTEVRGKKMMVGTPLTERDAHEKDQDSIKSAKNRLDLVPPPMCEMKLEK